MGAIYEPKGKAKEYCDLAINLYRGCNHSCSYCYSPDILYLSREDFKHAKNRNNILSQIDKEAHKYSGKEILLCFTCDPYQTIDEEFKLTRYTIEILLKNNIAVRILTKAGNKSMRDFDLLKTKNNNWYGATLTFTEDKDSLEYEPHASLPQDRIETLKEAKGFGINTWVSLEPVIIPEQTLKLIEATHGFVDVYKIGKWNHDIRANKIDWVGFRESAIEMCEKYNKKYYIKNDLANTDRRI